MCILSPIMCAMKFSMICLMKSSIMCIIKISVTCIMSSTITSNMRSSIMCVMRSSIMCIMKSSITCMMGSPIRSFVMCIMRSSIMCVGQQNCDGDRLQWYEDRACGTNGNEEAATGKFLSVPANKLSGGSACNLIHSWLPHHMDENGQFHTSASLHAGSADEVGGGGKPVRITGFRRSVEGPWARPCCIYFRISR